MRIGKKGERLYLLLLVEMARNGVVTAPQNLQIGGAVEGNFSHNGVESGRVLIDS